MNNRGAVLILLLLLVVSCGSSDDSAGEHHEQVAVEVAQAVIGDMTVYRDYTGTLEGIEQAVLTAKINETVTAVKVRPGDEVKSGDVLVRLNKSGPSSSFERVKAQYEFARKTLNKMKSLYSEGAISEQDFDQAQTNFDMARADFNSAKEIVEISSPISGIVTDVTVNVGDQAFAGENLVTVSRVDSVRLTIGVDPEDIGYLKRGMDARVYRVGSKDEWVPGTINRVASSADPKTRAFSVEVAIGSAGPGFLPGNFAGCTIPLMELHDVVKIPDRAIMLQEGIKKVFVVANDTAMVRNITTGESEEGFTEVVSGVDGSDVVVTVGQAFLQDRAHVIVNNREAESR